MVKSCIIFLSFSWDTKAPREKLLDKCIPQFSDRKRKHVEHFCFTATWKCHGFHFTDWETEAFLLTVKGFQAPILQGSQETHLLSLALAGHHCHHLWRGNGALPWAPRLLRQHPALRAPSFCLAMCSLLPCLPASEQTLANRVRKTHCFPPRSLQYPAECFLFLFFKL